MKQKLWIAGAIVAIIAVCVVAVSAASLASQEPAAPQLTEQQMEQQIQEQTEQQREQQVCSVSGYIIDFMGNRITNNPVTLHLMSYDDAAGQEAGSWEVYSLTTTTVGEGPKAGNFTFDNVIITPGTKYVYLSSSMQQPDGKVYTGISSNFTVQADASIKINFVLPVMIGGNNA